ncbi:multiple sugar transport system permease protein [Paenibacillus sp. SORGH_AS306]|uniref:carbohydrate ABC transporter permease n=1 Tax=unclassified Paenibacillus TaxID=185978 RepID=UPI002787FF32|nr:MULTISPECIES: carbohydrate ABC transporter permease [unclassified Paenibacillus]MDQ1234325.1 multiple sugar transport system permease protein [Paenibacillus sp. SORGH_AS_0306]MDR6111371.1 multiple sugar transport system permease protein [Paenibacillus sp. SORGH_AS_0338]
MQRKSPWLDSIVLVFLIVTAVAMMIPYLWMVVSSFKSNMDIMSGQGSFFPNHPTLEGYFTVFEDAPFVKWMWNSAISAVIITIITLFTSALAGYVFAKHQFKGKRILFMLILATMMIPFQVIMIPTYLITARLGLIDHLAAIILPNLVSSYGVFLAKQFIEDIPQDLLDAARIDGAGELRLMIRIIAPLILPMLSALGIFTFMNAWNNYLWPLIVLNDTDHMTVPLALVYFNGTHVVNYNVVMSAAVLITLPVMIVFLIFQKQFIKGLTMTGMK